ncbi:MAG: deoxyribonuclease IV [Promethearchaeota archaeon Loki_b31]|nr:MAG: deoxyribonuclease IV [Candidatus Lokiarchaeota archaeon Loki_b31]
MRLGAHMSVTGGKYMALERGKELGCQSIQVFIRSVRSWSAKPLDKKDIEDFLKTKEELKEEIWPIISHNSYLINLASIDKEKLEKSYNAMLDELIKADQLDIEYENMHPGVIPISDNNEISKKEALIQMANQLNKLIDETKGSKVQILLETTAGQGKGLGNKFHHLATIIDKIKDKNRIGVCFDTAHSFAAGYDFTTKKKYDEMWTEFDDIIGLKYLFAFHLNDTEKDLGSRVDRHTHIGQGKIGKEPFGFLLNDDRFRDHPGIIETPKGKDMKEDIMNLKILRSLIK